MGRLYGVVNCYGGQFSALVGVFLGLILRRVGLSGTLFCGF